MKGSEDVMHQAFLPLSTEGLLKGGVMSKSRGVSPMLIASIYQLLLYVNIKYLFVNQFRKSLSPFGTEGDSNMRANANYSM
jgi:hypothetical protein